MFVSQDMLFCLCSHGLVLYICASCSPSSVVLLHLLFPRHLCLCSEEEMLDGSCFWVSWLLSAVCLTPGSDPSADNPYFLRGFHNILSTPRYLAPRIPVEFPPIDKLWDCGMLTQV
eukprot:GHVQ01000314.1.p1 GENE.GHVQ01000314.1~~GHVQ01000314.1.p1  ORF type:complete len:116 (-),score=6.13 GHVQ01000314.1:218-565(-)